MQNAPREHSAILSTCIKLPSVIKIFVVSILTVVLSVFKTFVLSISGHLEENGWPPVCDVYCDFDTFPFGILGQVWCLIVLIPYLCPISYFYCIIFQTCVEWIDRDWEDLCAAASWHLEGKLTHLSWIEFPALINWPSPFPFQGLLGDIFSVLFKSRGCCLKMRPIGWVFYIIRGTPASVNAMKQTCVIVILAYFTLFQPNWHWKRCQTFCPFSNTWFL